MKLIIIAFLHLAILITHGRSDIYVFPLGETPPVSIIEATRICEEMAKDAGIGKFNPTDVHLMGGKPSGAGAWVFKQYTKIAEEYVYAIDFFDKTAMLIKMMDHSGKMESDVILATYSLEGLKPVRIPNPPPLPEDPEDPFADEPDSTPQGPKRSPSSGSPGEPASDDPARINQTSNDPAGASLTLRESRLDGLPLHLIELDPDDIKGGTVINLAPAFKRLGLPIPGAGSIVYDTGNGMLSRKLSPMLHDFLENALANTHRFEGMRAACKAYYALFKPLSGKERVATALRTGFLPDPLISSLIDKIRQHMSVIPTDPFADKEGLHPFPASEEKLNGYKSVLEALLDRKIKELEEHLKLMESPNDDSRAPRQDKSQPTIEPTR